MPTEEFMALPLEERFVIRLNFLKLWLQQMELVDYYRKLGTQEGNILIEGMATELLEKFSVGTGPSNEEIQEFWNIVNDSCINTASFNVQEEVINDVTQH